MRYNAGDYLEVIYCAKDITVFALASEMKQPQTGLSPRHSFVLIANQYIMTPLRLFVILLFVNSVPLAIAIASLPFFVTLFIPLFLGSVMGTALAVTLATTGGLVMRAQRLVCCNKCWQKCKDNQAIIKVVSEVTTMGNSPELEIPSGSESNSINYQENDCITGLVDSESFQIV